MSNIETRNNSERLGSNLGTPPEESPESSSSFIVPDPVAKNPALSQLDIMNKMLSLTCMEELIKIPSRGRFYPAGHPFASREDIYINVMTSKEQDILSSKVKWQENKVFESLLVSLLKDRVDPGTILSGDRMAIFAAARITLKHTYETNGMCPICRTITHQVFNLTEALDAAFEELRVKEENMKPFEMGAISKGGSIDTFITELPATKMLAEFRLLYGIHEDMLMKKKAKTDADIARAKTAEEKSSIKETDLTDILKVMVVSLSLPSGEKTSEPGVLAKIIERLPGRDTVYLQEMYKYVAPELQLQEIKCCPKCLQSTHWGIPYTDFFRPS